MSYELLREQQQVAGAVFANYGGRELAAHFGDSAQEYQAVLSHAAVIDTSPAGRLWLRDRDRLALLQRLSTNDVERLEPGQGARTVLTNHHGRIIDLLTMHALPEQVLVTTSPQQRAAVISLLRKNIFFSDKLTLEDASDKTGQLTIYGPHTEKLLSRLTEAPLAKMEPHAILTDQVGDARVWITRAPPLGGSGITLYILLDDLPLVWAALVQIGVQPLGMLAYEILRIEAGYGRYGRELSLDYIPLETGLWDAVSFSKGCYVGQEIIARMESRGRLAKQLRGLALSDMLEVAPGAPLKLEADGKEAGDLTSVTRSPRFGPIGLAYVRTAHAAPGTSVGIAGSTVQGEVVALPFGTPQEETP
jgi:aminomethyltransferase